MDVKLAEFKRKLLDTGLFRKVSGDGQYVCKTCPFCGDVKSHMYVKIKQDEDMPVLYNCFKCNARGIVNEQFISYFGIDDIEIPKIKGRRRIQPNSASTEIMDVLDFEKDTEMMKLASDYIEYRVGVYPSKNDLQAFQIIGNPVDYVNAYLGGDLKGLKDRIWFRLSNGNMIGRSLDPENSFRWKKRNYMGKDYINQSGIYVIKKMIDPTTTINVCICEGVMDAIGLYYHSGVNNAVFIGCMGRDYMLGIKYVIDHGFFGDSVCIRIYKDADVDRVLIKKIYAPFFKSIGVYRNTIGKDFGLKANEIEIEKCSF